LAACFLDSLATLDIPAVGYGIRYEFGIFRQTFEDGWQVERPDGWLSLGNPWEFPQSDDMVLVGFWGHTETFLAENGSVRTRWVPSREVLGEPCTTLVPGSDHDRQHPASRRARATEEFDFQLFDVGITRGRREDAVGDDQQVLYPTTRTPTADNFG
jgi:starch phosphorylase